MKDLDVLCLGEALVDLLPDRRGKLSDCERFEAHTGGAPANVAVGLARLGCRVGFQGVVGADPFGDLLARKLAEEGIEVRLRRDPQARTGVVFVAIDEAGDRTFFAPGGKHTADKRLSPDDVDAALVARARWLHVGTFAHALPGARGALRAALAAARAGGTRVSFDPNVRVHAWEDPDDRRALCRAVLPACDLVKVAADECELAASDGDPERAAELLESAGARVACVTLGAAGALVRHRGRTLRVPAERVPVVDTTGAGDGFVAGLLAALALADAGAEVPEEVLGRAARLGCHVAGRVCGRLGAVAGLPLRRDLPRGLA